MEHDLVSVQSYLINQIELGLLETTSIVDDNENFKMSYDLLDRNPESMHLGQSGQLPVFLRVLYKGHGDFLTDKAWEPHKLGAKDPGRSTPNYTLLDATGLSAAGRCSSFSEDQME